MQHARGREMLGTSGWLASLQKTKRVLDRFFLWTGYLAGVLFTILAFFITYDVLPGSGAMCLAFPRPASRMKSAAT